VSLLISENNVESLTATIESLRQATDTLPQTAAAANEFVHELRATLAEFHGTARQLRATVDEARPDIEVILERLSKAASDLAAASNRLEGFIENTDKNVGRFTDQGLFELEQLLREGRSALAEFRELSRSLREDPSRILYQPPVSGVEIEP
jgi:ABC-type transporter Mla subunit MlaD